MHLFTSSADIWRRFIAVALLAAINVTGDVHADDETGPPDALGVALAKRVPLTTSRLVGSPEPPLPYRVRRVYPGVTLKQPIYVEREPGTDNLIMIHYLEGTGGPSRIVRMVDDPDVSQTELLLECPRFIYGLTFHPNYEQNGFLYLHTNSPDQDGKRLNQVLRYTVNREPPYNGIEESQLVIIEWHSGGHDGGDLAFGNDGMLYITSGDGSSTSDVLGTGQDPSNLLAAVLRIDVDHVEIDHADVADAEVDDAAADRPYSVPSDNPFVGVEGVRPEIWAYGLRNPFRMSADPATGQIWVGNNGQDLWEQAYLLQRGANYGWPVVEGTHPFQPERPRGPTPFTAPTVEHPHSIARSLTGGVVYHGNELAELRGAYFYGDYSTGRIWAVRHDGDSIEWHRVVADTTLQITGFGLDTHGELLIVDHAGGMYRLELTPPADALAPFPERLSETGLFMSVANHVVQPGVVPYSVNAERWADGAHKASYIALPGTSTVDFSASGHWKFPEATVLLQTLSVDESSATSTQMRRLETRVLLRQQGEWAGYSYRWNDEQTDALLVAADGDELEIDLADPFTGRTSSHRWQIPSRIECMVCHSRAAEYVLGLSTPQMNRPHDYNFDGNGDGVELNQLVAWKQMGMFTADIEEPLEHLVHMVDPYDSSADLTARARSYLHANCQHCHLNSGGGNADFEIDFQRSLDKTALVDVKPVHSTFGLDDARLVAPGHPEQSVLFYRLAKLGVGRMPQLGTAQLDREGIRLLHDWITSLPVDGASEAAADSADGPSIDALTGTSADANEVANELLSTTSGALQLLQAIDTDQLPEPVAELAIRLGKTHPQETTRDLFERFIPADERIERLGNYVDIARLLAIPGDAERGRTLLLNHEGLTCRSCHAVAGEGDGAAGPDLAGVGQKYPPAELLDTILNPSARIDAAYATTVVQTDDGRTLTGVVTHRDDRLLRLRDADNKLIELAITDVEGITPQPTSLMPEFLLRGLTPQQAADLLAFLSSLKTPLASGGEPAR